MKLFLKSTLYCLFFFSLFFCLFLFAGVPHLLAGQDNPSAPDGFKNLITQLSDTQDRSSGSKGAKDTGVFIKSHFTALGFKTVGSHSFSMPVRKKTHTRIKIETSGISHEIDPFLSNVISPDTIAPEGLTGRMVYVGKGRMKDFNHKKIKDAIVLMDMDSSENWINALSLGARAIIYLFDTPPDKFLFTDKKELSPVQFPRFILSYEKVSELFPGFTKTEGFIEKKRVTLISDLAWHNRTLENIYCMIPGTDDTLKDEMIVVESFYDTSGFIPGKSPGADQACSIATLLDLSRHLKNYPPKRSILLLATAGQQNSLAGMREMMWSIDIKPRALKKLRSHYKKRIALLEADLALLDTYNQGQEMNLEQKMDPEQLDRVKRNILDMTKTRIDLISNQLMQLRLESDPDEVKIKHLATKRMVLKRLESKNDLSTLTVDEKGLLKALVPSAVAKLGRQLSDAGIHQKNLASSGKFRKLARSKKIRAILSLHLSSHGSGFGAFNEGWLYDIKESVNTFSPYVKLNEILLKSAGKTADQLETSNLFKDSLRPSLHRSWQSYFLDTPALGGEVSQLAGYLGLSLVTTHDARQYWGTPYDTLEKVDIANAADQSRFISRLISTLSAQEDLSAGRLPRNGFATVKGRANFIRHGAVFADAPAPKSTILSFQGPGIFYSHVDESGEFFIRGAATKKLTLHKVILEGYRFDPVTGQTLWAVDKKKTTKARYRVKVTKKNMETDLVMFPCSQTTILNLLEPRTFRHMTKLQILDARMEATPVRYWYSRIDTRKSLISSIYLSPGTRLKLGLSDTLLTKKFILTHSTEKQGEGNGYRIDETPLIAPTQYLAAKDMWSLLNPRINNLEAKGINSQKIRDLQSLGNEAIAESDHFFKTQRYDKFFSASGNALGLAGRVYDHVESIQKDVLYGVLFYIVLFAPFAFCLERFLFAFINIYKRIGGFTGILIVLIGIIYNVHPAFELAYSPIVVILAFFIIGLSAMVTWIISNHFENEMKQLQRQGKRGNEGEISFFKAFSASFFMGLNNLRRRRMRTALTCTTLIILTFTIMSFTSVKSIRQHSKLLYNNTVPYQGLLLKQINWKSLPEKAWKVIENTMADTMIAAPRVWLETGKRTQTTQIPIRSGGLSAEANGLIGLSHREAAISGLSRQITRGRWFSEKDRYSILIPERMAQHLHLPDPGTEAVYIYLWSIPFNVIGTFSGEAFDKFRDLDGEPLTPATFPDEIFQKTTEAEMEALESGEDIKAFQSRYKHIPFDQTVIIPHNTLLTLGGSLKSVALKFKTGAADTGVASRMVDRFGLPLFSGEKTGVFLYNASDNLNYAGLPNVMVPILISIFIVLNTMIGSVQERKREIGIYTSIGMAPSHVSIIFIAEAVAYAVLSVVSGYILAQVVVKVFAGTTLLSGLTVNYSSLGGVFAMAMVMLVVLLSSLYPSRVAASIAIPDVEKSWELEKPEGDTLSIELPFLINSTETLSICGYLYHLFNTHRAVSHGIFSVGRLSASQGKKSGEFMNKDSMGSTSEEKEKESHIAFTAWLAPFDLGIMQRVGFDVGASSRFKNYMEIGMTINRKSGEQNTWWRINKRFVNLIRKELLVWRSLDIEEKERYQSMMAERYNKKDIPHA